MNFNQPLDNEMLGLMNQRSLWLLRLLKIFKYRAVIYKIEYLFPNQKIYSWITFFKHLIVAALPAH